MRDHRKLRERAREYMKLREQAREHVKRGESDSLVMSAVGVHSARAHVREERSRAPLGRVLVRPGYVPAVEKFHLSWKS